MAPEIEIFEIIRDILASDFGLARAELVPESRIAEDLDLDSLDAIDLAHRLEEKTGLSLPEEGFESIHTLWDVVDCLLAQRAGAGHGLRIEDGTAVIEDGGAVTAERGAAR